MSPEVILQEPELEGCKIVQLVDPGRKKTKIKVVYPTPTNKIEITPPVVSVQEVANKLR